MKQKKKYMQLAIELAKRGFGSVEPNPLVGCVIVAPDGSVIGQGWHKKYGDNHAEINALIDCKQRGHNPKGATMCVTLEPCCHHGKTAPCTDTIIQAGIDKVVIAMTDPSEKVAGKGIKLLQEASVKVSIGLCEKQAKLLNPAFIKHSQTALPWVILKWAQTIDGKLSAAGLPDGQRWISNEASRKDVHKLRRSCQAILIGVDTAMQDDPLLTARPVREMSPLRIVLDSKLRISKSLKLFSTIKDADLMIVTTKQSFDSNIKKVSELVELGAEVLAIDADSEGYCDLSKLFTDLGKNQIQRILIEAGPSLIKALIKKQLADEAVIYIAPKIFANAGKAPLPQELNEITELPTLYNTQTQIFDGDIKITANLIYG